MAVTHGFAFPKEPGKPSSGDGASVESANDPNTGASIPGYQPPLSPPSLSTVGGLDSQLSRDRDPSADYRRAQAQSSMVTGAGAAGFGLSHSADSEFSSTGTVPADSTGVAGGPAADHRFVQRTAGADDGEEFGKSIG
jgi:hypothetical protein